MFEIGINGGCLGPKITILLSFVQVGYFRMLSSTNKTEHHDITEILLKMVFLNTTTLPYPMVSQWLNGIVEIDYTCDFIHATSRSLPYIGKSQCHCSLVKSIQKLPIFHLCFI